MNGRNYSNVFTRLYLLYLALLDDSTIYAYPALIASARCGIFQISLTVTDIIKFELRQGGNNLSMGWNILLNSIRFDVNKKYHIERTRRINIFYHDIRILKNACQNRHNKLHAIIIIEMA